VTRPTATANVSSYRWSVWSNSSKRQGFLGFGEFGLEASLDFVLTLLERFVGQDRLRSSGLPCQAARG
jgi:hypothetical protein